MNFYSLNLMGHFSTTASACRFLFPFPSASSLPSILLVLWRRIIRRHSGTAHVQYGMWLRMQREGLGNFQTFHWPLSQTSSDTYHPCGCFVFFFSLFSPTSLYLGTTEGHWPAGLMQGIMAPQLWGCWQATVFFSTTRWTPLPTPPPFSGM